MVWDWCYSFKYNQVHEFRFVFFFVISAQWIVVLWPSFQFGHQYLKPFLTIEDYPRLVHFSHPHGVTKVLLLVSLRILQGAQAVTSWGLGEPCINPQWRFCQTIGDQTICHDMFLSMNHFLWPEKIKMWDSYPLLTMYVSFLLHFLFFSFWHCGFLICHTSRCAC